MKIQKKDKQSSREKLALMLQRFFLNKKANVTLHLDGFAVSKINAGRIKIIYSENTTADEKIKNQIEKSKSPRTITVITSDSNLTQFAKVCSCKVIPSEDFAKQLNNKSQNDEQTIIDSMKNDDEFKKLFGV
mgnify:FL=1